MTFTQLSNLVRENAYVFCRRSPCEAGAIKTSLQVRLIKNELLNYKNLSMLTLTFINRLMVFTIRLYNTTLPPFALAVLPTHEIFAVAQLAGFHFKNSGNHPNLHSHSHCHCHCHIDSVQPISTNRACKQLVNNKLP
jgi:hypothetical protein